MADRETVTQVTELHALGKGPPRDSVLLGKYRVESTLGFGGMGVVIKARHLGLDEYVAIKIMRDDVDLDEEHIERFVREAKAAVRLKSEHVARIRDVGTFESGMPYMVMELLEGRDLGVVLHDQERLEPKLAVDLVLQACDALAEAHAIGIVHRDIKPTNLFVTFRRDESMLLKVLDFGISKVAMSHEMMSLTQTSSMLGTPAYMSPEQMRSARTVDGRTDIWSLGTVLYELVEGDLPFDAGNFAELCVMMSTEPPRQMIHAPELQAVVLKCLEKSVDDRFANMAELALALEPHSSDPRRARHQVTRIQRMLGLSSPRDSTPAFTIPRSRDATPAAKVASPTLPDALSRSRVWLLVVALVALFGVGIGAGLIVTRDSAVDSAVPAPAIAPPITTTEPRVEDRAGSAEVIPDARPADAAAATIPRPPRPPVHPPAPPPPVVDHPPAAGSAKPCDPFASIHSC